MEIKLVNFKHSSAWQELQLWDEGQLIKRGNIKKRVGINQQMVMLFNNTEYLCKKEHALNLLTEGSDDWALTFSETHA